MYNSILLDKHNERLVTFYEKLYQLPYDRYTIHSISKLLDVPYNVTASHLETIHEILRQITPDFLFITEGKILISSDLPDNHQIFCFLAKEEMPYLYIKALLSEKYLTIESFCQVNYMSVSSMKRRLLPLQIFLNRYNIRLKINSMTLLGDERMIRLAFQELIWIVSHGEDEYFHHLNLDSINQAFAPLLTRVAFGNLQFNEAARKLMAEITYIRISKGHYVDDSDIYDEYLQGLIGEDFQAFQRALRIPQKKLSGEARFICFLGFYGPTFYYEDDPYFNQVQQTNYSSFVKEFYDTLTLFLTCDLFKSAPLPRNYRVLLNNLMNLFFDFYVFQHELPLLFYVHEFPFASKKTYAVHLHDRVYTFFEKLSKKENYSWLTRCLEEITTACFLLILTPFQEMIYTENKLHVSIQSKGNYLFFQKAEAFLLSLSFVTYFPLKAEDLNQCDAILSTTDLVIKDVPVLKIPFFMKESNYFELYSQLKQLHMAKIARLE